MEMSGLRSQLETRHSPGWRTIDTLIFQLALPKRRPLFMAYLTIESILL